MAAGEWPEAEGRQHLAMVDAQIARLAPPKAAGPFYYRPTSQRVGGYTAFLNRFAREPAGAVDVGNGGLITTADDGAEELRIYGPIDDYFGIGAAAVSRALDEHEVVRVRLNSPGGDVFAGVAIANAIRERELPVIVDGVAASIASVIAASSPRVTMAAGAFLMIHRAWTQSVGNGDDMRETGAVLDKLDAMMAAIYSRKSGSGNADSWRAIMAAETWYSAAEAVDSGLADEHAEEEASGITAARGFDMAMYHGRVPLALRREAA
jgi:ATP-dependent Clp protease protease subunit